jgi:membrane protease YdiL (CAAX protease family)
MKRIQSQFVVFLCFVGVMVASLLLAALLSPLAFHALGVFPFHRVFDRTAEFVFVVGAVGLIRRLGAGDRATLGFGGPASRQLAMAFLGWCVGICLLSATVLGLFMLGIREWIPGQEASLSVLLDLLPAALLSGLAVGSIEESFFRGAMYGGIRQRGTAAMTVILTAVLYSAVHFLGEKFRIPAEQVDWSSGFVLLSKYFAAYAQPRLIVDDFVALALLGMFLAAVRERTGQVALCIGLHAGFVTVIGMAHKASVAVYDHPWSFLIGRTNGIVGWLVAVVAAASTVVVIAWPTSRAPESSPGATDWDSTP